MTSDMREMELLQVVEVARQWAQAEDSRTDAIASLLMLAEVSDDPQEAAEMLNLVRVAWPIIQQQARVKAEAETREQRHAATKALKNAQEALSQYRKHKQQAEERAALRALYAGENENETRSTVIRSWKR